MEEERHTKELCVSQMWGKNVQQFCDVKETNNTHTTVIMINL